MVTYLERLCTALGHRFAPLCSFVVRQDGWWLRRNSARAGAAPFHCELRERFESGMSGLPFASAAPESVASLEEERSERRAKSA
jgi:hypothetical protein